jgi:hypothetical protein
LLHQGGPRGIPNSQSDSGIEKEEERSGEAKHKFVMQLKILYEVEER